MIEFDFSFSLDKVLPFLVFGDPFTVGFTGSDAEVDHVGCMVKRVQLMVRSPVASVSSRTRLMFLSLKMVLVSLCLSFSLYL